MTTRTKTAELTAETVSETARECAGVACRLRQTVKQNSSWGYCEGCPSHTRLCRSCGQRKAQTGWWWGTDKFGMRTDMWACGACRFDLVELWDGVPESGPHRDELMNHLSTHPEMAALLAARPTFTATLPMTETQRHDAARLLGRAATMSGSDATAVVAAAVRAAADGKVTVDVSEFDMVTRVRVGEALYGAVHRAAEPLGSVGDALGSLLKAWSSWLDGHVPALPPVPTHAERERLDRERALRALDGE